MSARDDALPAVAHSRTLDSAGTWFWSFLKSELSPYPGRAWVVGRMVISASIVMLLVMTFQIPNGFLGAIYTLFLSRENPNVTLVAGIRTTIVYCLAGIYTIISVMTLIDDPLTHFLWIVLSLFIAFYVISIVPDYFTAIGFGFTVAGAIPLWDQTTLTVNVRTENTLWIGFSVVIGTAVTVVVEYIFRRVRPTTDLNLGIETRLEAVEELLRQIADAQQSFKFEKHIALYSSVGTSRLRRMVVRSGYAPQLAAQMNAAIALLGRLVDLAASLQIARSTQFSVTSEEDRGRCLVLANKISQLCDDLKQRRTPRLVEIPTQTQPSELPLLPEMERTVALIPHAFSSSDGSSDLPGAATLDETATAARAGCIQQSQAPQVRLAGNGCLHGGLSHLHVNQLAGTEYCGCNLCNYRAVDDWRFAAKAVSTAGGGDDRRLWFWNGRPGLRASVPQFHRRIHGAVRHRHCDFRLDLDGHASPVVPWRADGAGFLSD